MSGGADQASPLETQGPIPRDTAEKEFSSRETPVSISAPRYAIEEVAVLTNIEREKVAHEPEISGHPRSNFRQRPQSAAKYPSVEALPTPVSLALASESVTPESARSIQSTPIVCPSDPSNDITTLTLEADEVTRSINVRDSPLSVPHQSHHSPTVVNQSPTKVRPSLENFHELRSEAVHAFEALDGDDLGLYNEASDTTRMVQDASLYSPRSVKQPALSNPFSNAIETPGSMSKRDVAELEGFGFVDQFFYHMWRRDSGQPRFNEPHLMIPHTVTFNTGQPSKWFFTSKSNGPTNGEFQKKRRNDMASVL